MNRKELFKRNKHILFLLYCPIYLYCFQQLETRNNVSYTQIHCAIDDWIPFCELFVIPYILWFFYVAAVVIYLYFQRDHLEDFYRCALMLILGMSTCLLIYYLFPNEQNLRPETFANQNIFTDIVRFIYAADTNTNVLPSIHVYNSITIHVAFATSHHFHDKPVWRAASLVLCSLICLSTMFLKQHSFLDVITGLGLFVIYSALVYRVIPVLRAKRKNTSSLCNN